ncbi:hypothetical protein C8R45DRAFT_939597 [Mycena sanguinolenta]|nr:hypothetical protein C8R45DRAFT_939597 [Mycena sanguinolenta]
MSLLAKLILYQNTTQVYVPDARSRMNIVVAKIKPNITLSGLRVGTLKISSLGYRPAFGSSMERPWSIHRAQRCLRQGLKVTQWGHSNQLDRALVTSNTRKPVSRLSEQMGLPSRQTDLQADLPGLGFDLRPNPSPSPKKPVGAGASPFGKPKTSLSEDKQWDAVVLEFACAGMRLGIPQSMLTTTYDFMVSFNHNRDRLDEDSDPSAAAVHKLEASINSAQTRWIAGMFIRAALIDKPVIPQSNGQEVYGLPIYVSWLASSQKRPYLLQTIFAQTLEAQVRSDSWINTIRVWFAYPVNIAETLTQFAVHGVIFTVQMWCSQLKESSLFHSGGECKMSLHSVGVGVIMDGNRGYARRFGQHVSVGQAKGAAMGFKALHWWIKYVPNTASSAFLIHPRYLTFWTSPWSLRYNDRRVQEPRLHEPRPFVSVHKVGLATEFGKFLHTADTKGQMRLQFANLKLRGVMFAL